MEDDSYTEVTEESWVGRIGNALTGVLVGIAMIVGAAVLLFWNEGRTVKIYEKLTEGAGIVTSISYSKIDPAYEGKLVHLSGRATTTEVLKDGYFPISVTALALKRTVQMYQWDETKHSETRETAGGGEETVTSYTYEKRWSETLIHSSHFKKSAAHRNPSTKLIENQLVTANHVTFGAFSLPRNLVHQINSYEVVPAEPLLGLETQAQLSGNGYYIGNDEENPEIGDVKIRFSAVMPTDVTVVAQQSGESFTPYTASAGGQIEELAVGVLSAADMFDNAQNSNTLLSWGLRLLGVFLMLIGFFLLLNPLAVIADIVPLVGSIVEFGTGIIALLLTVIVSAIVVAVAWFFYRPVLALLLVAVAVAVVVTVILKRR